MRPKSSSRDLPIRMLRRTKKLKSGTIWVSYYYNGRKDDGARHEIPLGSDLNEAKRRWAELECKPSPADTNLMSHVFDRYEREIVPGKSPRTQKDNLEAIKNLRKAFDAAPIDAVTPQHIAQYRDKRSAKVRANREITLLSHIFNLAREWGYLSKDNPCRGVRKNKETPRDFYADDQTWKAVLNEASDELKDAMDIAYLTGQRPADVLKMMETDIRDGALEIRQNKTNKRLRIMLNRDDGSRTELGKVLDRIRERPKKIRSLYLVAMPEGGSLNRWTLRTRFDKARAAAALRAEESNSPEGNALAKRIKQFQFRDIRPKAASETNLEHARKLLGHTDSQITETVYRRVGEVVQPIK